MDTVIIFEIMAFATTLLWFEFFQMGTRLKRLFGIPAHVHRKPFDCRFCTHHWIGFACSFWVLYETEFYYWAVFICLNFIIAFYYEHSLQKH